MLIVGERHPPIWLASQLSSLLSLLASVASFGPSWRVDLPLCVEDSMKGRGE